MKSIEYLQDQIDNYMTYANEALKEKCDYKRKMEEAQEVYELNVAKADEVKILLDMVKEDFNKYTWNPAG